MATGVTIQDDDRKLRSLMREVAKLRRAVVTVGIHGDGGEHTKPDGSPAGVTNVEIGASHEFGIGVPERSFLRSTVDNSRVPLDTAQQAAADVCNGKMTAHMATQRIGVMVKGEVQKTIHNKIAPPLSPETIAKRKAKGAHGGGLASMADDTTPLIDSGQLIASIVYKVEGA